MNTNNILAGYSAIQLPSKLELNDAPVAKTLTTKACTMGYYLIGAVTTATILQFLKK